MFVLNEIRINDSRSLVTCLKMYVLEFLSHHRQIDSYCSSDFFILKYIHKIEIIISFLKIFTYQILQYINYLSFIVIHDLTRMYIKCDNCKDCSFITTLSFFTPINNCRHCNTMIC